MSDGEPAATARSATNDVADALPSPSGPRPFARPTPTDGGRSTAVARGAPFVAPPTSASGTRVAEPPDRPVAASPATESLAEMTWPGPAELAAAHALDAVARRLRAGALRLPVAVDPAVPTAIVAVVLAALHAESAAAGAPRDAERMR